MPHPVLDARSCILSKIGSGTGYRIAIGVYLYRVWYQVPDPVKYSFHWICCQLPDLVFLFFVDPVLGTGLNARSSTGYRT